MSTSTSDWMKRARSFLSSDLWRTDFRAGSLATLALRALQVVVMIGQGFVRDQLLLRASGLTYMTLMSVIPLFAVSFSIVSALGVSENLVKLAVETLAAGSPEAQSTIIDLVQKADIRGMGTLGAGILVITTVLALRQIEETFNKIWGVRHSRSWMRRFSDYLSVIVVAPLFAGMALSLATTLQSEPLVHKLLEYPVFQLLYDLGLEQMPRVFLVIAFTFLYWFFPNTSVRLICALAGGVVSALLFLGAQQMYVQFNIGAARASALFGSFAVLPLFLAWNYISWAIVLLGSELSFALQNLSHYRREIRSGAPGAAELEAAGLVISVEVARCFRDGALPQSADELADRLGLSVRTVREILRTLEQDRIVSACAPGDRATGYQLARPAERILVLDVLKSLRGQRHWLDEEEGEATVSAVGQLLEELETAVGRVAAARSLAEVLEKLPGSAEVATPAAADSEQ
jgi:membrane protein